MPPGARDSRRKVLPPKPWLSSGFPFPAEVIGTLGPDGENRCSSRCESHRLLRGGRETGQKKQSRMGKGKTDFFLGAGVTRRRHGKSRCEPGCAGSRPFPWGLFPKQQQQIGCRFQGGWGNKRKSNRNPLTAEIKGDQRPNTQSAPSSSTHMMEAALHAGCN